MSNNAALIGFPRLQEQIATRLLAEHDVVAERIDLKEAASRLEMFNVALFFWPDRGDHTATDVKQLREQTNGSPPLLIVASQVVQQSAREMVGTLADDILTSPIQPHELSQKLSKFTNCVEQAKPIALDASFINPFVEGTVATLKQMADLDCERTGIQLTHDAETRGDISGIIGLSGEASGFVAVTFRMALAKRIISRMLDMEEDEKLSDADIQDGVGEFMNVVAGSAKAKLTDTQHAFTLSLPTVVRGTPHSVGQPRGLPVFTIEFESEKEPFQVLVCLIPNKQ